MVQTPSWMIEHGPEWDASWAEVAAKLTRPDAPYGAVVFAMRHDPWRYSQGFTEPRDTRRLFRTRDLVDGHELWVYVAIRQMTSTVTLLWAQLAAPTESGDASGEG